MGEKNVGLDESAKWRGFIREHSEFNNKRQTIKKPRQKVLIMPKANDKKSKSVNNVMTDMQGK